MREIKFRGIETDDNEWVYGYYIVQSTTLGDLTSVIFDGEWEHVVAPETVGQYTGLKDSKRTEEYPEGQEIYEGDILLDSVDGYRWVVEYDCELAALWLKCVGADDHILFDEFNPSKDLKVIGNIYANPELLEV